MIGKYRREFSVAFAYLLILGFLALEVPQFFDGRALLVLAVKNAPVLVAAVGMTLVILCRQIDISIGSQASVCAVTAGLLAKSGMPMPVVGLGTLLVGAGLGACNGLLVAGLGLPSIVVTLATLVILRESLRYLREGAFVRELPSGFQWFGVGQETGQWFVVGIGLLVLLFVAWGMRNLAAGRSIYATGSDPEAARLAGLRPRAVTFWIFVAMGTLAGLYALLEVIQLPEVDPKTGTDGLEMRVIAAAVVGGAAVSGGRGTIIGTLIGVLLLGTINPALVYLHVSAEWEKAIQGAIILLAVASDGLSRESR
ncbi:ABC transporter permease [Tundrisphaera lichenicola]|uniref:ABC transporter permease n=1 Tax=Tundrisphaera lichenicola TaxID=2029860 RepID=UPI003EBA0EE4